ncbi:DUF4346 domain-containing protein [Candidatus Woesearchaeota archaeon]|nr:hypothetical protein [uncultured archaeon]MBS3142074.1 DUF4346 domain-containing protein [Candidatus Woesearchaeota archaeon]
MARIQIEFFRNVCIGNFSCVSMDPEHFSRDESKAALEGAVKHGDHHALVKNLTEEEIEHAVEAAAACPVNAIRITNMDTHEVLYDTAVKQAGAKEITAHYSDEKEFVLDPQGYFLIKVDYEKRLLEIAFCKDPNTISYIVRGKKPIEVYQTVLREKIITRPDHAAYLGRELQKAHIALEHGLEYVQDDELDFSRKHK